MPAKKPTGFVIYEGPSLLDGAPIVCIATLKSRNGKTGNMLQTWIMRADIAPIAANRSGADFSICGNCRHRGTARPLATKGLAAGRSCYVALAQAPMWIWNHFRKGGYSVAIGHAAIAGVGRGRKVRVGAYGDGAAVPAYVMDSLLSEAAGWTAYSHQSEVTGAAFDGARYMVSADDLETATASWARGLRTFRVLRSGEKPVRGQEISCPSLKGVHCIDCGLCAGASKRAKSITIPAHGAGAVNFE